MVNKQVVKRNFSKYADHYDEHSEVQKISGLELVRLLEGGDYSRILEVGCGTGAYTELLSREYPAARITAVDISEEMIRKAAEKVKSGKVNFLAADGEDLQLDGEFDLITSNASFQWFDGLGYACERFRRFLADDGVFCCAVYGPGTFNELNGVLCLHLGRNKWLSAARFNPQEKIRRAVEEHFTLGYFSEKNYTVEFDSLMDLLRDIKKSGSRGEGLGGGVFLGRDLLSDMEKSYRDIHRGIIATHQVFYIKAGKRRSGGAV